MGITVIVGRLTRDPEYTPAHGGKQNQRVNFTVAVDNRHNSETSYFDCVAFGKLADIIDKWTFKGKMVEVVGDHEQGEPYKDKNGNTRRSWSLWVERCKLLDGKREEQTSEPKQPEHDAFREAEEEIPF